MRRTLEWMKARMRKEDPSARTGSDDRDLVGHDLEGRDFRHRDLRGVDLRGADLFGARLDGADLRGARMDMTRLVEIALPRDLSADIINQIRQFDFRYVMPRDPIADSGVPQPCPYRASKLRPLLYEWGSRTWHGGRDWRPPTHDWTLEHIVAAVLDELGCRHDLERPSRVAGLSRRVALSAVASG